MPMPMPFPTRQKPPIDKPTDVFDKNPEESNLVEDNPTAAKLVGVKPNKSRELEENPDITPKVEDNPDVTPEVEENPEASPPNLEYPKDVDPENCVVFNDKVIEIKPTKLKYFRNKTAAGYSWLKMVPLTEFLMYKEGSIPNENRSADQILFDFLIAAFDDKDFVMENYDEFDADQVDRIVKIFSRLNHLDEKEEQIRKNREAQMKKD